MSPKVIKTCAYCGSSGPFSREHIIPDFLYRQYPDQKFGYNEKAGGYVEWEGVVKDVCTTCNSGALSDLDAYAKSFTEKNRCHRTFQSRPTILLYYDYDLLLRWLLKCTYNAMRHADRDTSEISKNTSYILGSGPLPFKPELYVELIRDEPIPERKRHTLPGELKDMPFIPSKVFRLGEVSSLNLDYPCFSRFVAINAYYFYFMLFPLITDPEEFRAVLNTLRHLCPQIVRLKPTKRSVDVRVSKRTALDAKESQLLWELPAWRKYLSQRESEKGPRHE
jgi:hypothetical protein